MAVDARLKYIDKEMYVLAFSLFVGGGGRGPASTSFFGHFVFAIICWEEQKAGKQERRRKRRGEKEKKKSTILIGIGTSLGGGRGQK